MCLCGVNNSTDLTTHTGKDCETFIPCSDAPCQNEGECSDLEDFSDYTCACGVNNATSLTTHTGKDCETFIPCSDAPCQNDGECADLEDYSDYECTCAVNNSTDLTTHTGKDCETFVPCSDAPCQNDGECGDLEDYSDYECTCAVNNATDLTTHTGKDCETFIPCSDAPCQNEGECSDFEDYSDYMCLCGVNNATDLTTHTGKDCETFIPCSDAPCLNDGECSDLEDYSDYTCACTVNNATDLTEFTGKDCETFIPCSPGPCQNEAECSNFEDYTDYECACVEGWENKDCDAMTTCHAALVSALDLASYNYTMDNLTPAEVESVGNKLVRFEVDGAVDATTLDAVPTATFDYDSHFELEFTITLGEAGSSRHAVIFRSGLGAASGYMNPSIYFNNAKYGWSVAGISVDDNAETSGRTEQRMFVYTGWQEGETHAVFIKAVEGVLLFYSDGELMNRAAWNGEAESDKCSTYTPVAAQA
jgi:hypothetical protein